MSQKLKTAFFLFLCCISFALSSRAEDGLCPIFNELDTYLNEQGAKIDLPEHFLTSLLGVTVTGIIATAVYKGYTYLYKALEDSKSDAAIYIKAEKILKKNIFLHSKNLSLVERTSELKNQINAGKYSYPFITYAEKVSQSIEDCITISKTLGKRIHNNLHCIDTLKNSSQLKFMQNQIQYLITELHQLFQIITAFHEYKMETKIANIPRFPLVIVLPSNSGY